MIAALPWRTRLHIRVVLLRSRWESLARQRWWARPLTVDGLPCYYRSRGEGWQFHVASWPDGDALAEDAWVYSERPYFFPQGGWVSPEVSRECIRRAVSLYRAGRQGVAS